MEARREAGAHLRKPPALRRRADFVRVQQHGRRFRQGTVIVLVDRGVGVGVGVRVGYTVSRRVGHAVTRNRVRRRLREIVRLEQWLLVAGYDYVIVAATSAGQAGHARLRVELMALLEATRVWALRQGAAHGRVLGDG